MTGKFKDELETAKRIALEVWPKIAPIYDAPIEFEDKADGTPVTKADKLSNRFIVEEIRKKFPNDSIVSEEEKAVVNGRRTWYIDPIDGTKGFIKHNGHFAIHIGFCEGKEPSIGVVYWPVAGEMYLGVVGEGAWRENSRGRIELKVRPMREGLVAMVNGDTSPAWLAPILSELGVKSIQNSGSEGLRLVKIAENIADMRICESERGSSTWDLCAPQAVVAAAGGIFGYTDGTSIEYTGQGRMGKPYFVANSRGLADKILGITAGRKNEKTPSLDGDQERRAIIAQYG